jgi:hypothetical protein
VAEPSSERVTYYAGLDLGLTRQFSALAVLERRCSLTEEGDEGTAAYAVRHLQRFPPGTPYSIVVEAVRAVFADPPIKGGTLVVDQTAVGRAVFESVRDAMTGASVRGLSVTAGHALAADDWGGWLVPKKDLVGVLQVLLQEKRLKVSQALKHARTLTAELHQFQLKAVPLKPDALEWRERPHDDLVLAVGIAVWQGERYFPLFVWVSPPSDPEAPRSPWAWSWSPPLW